MVKLFCAIVGVAGSAFSIRVAEDDSVDDLKKAIAEDQKYDFAASKLQLFLAKTTAGAWLQDVDPSVLELEEGRIHPDVQTLIKGEKMRATWTIGDVLKENKMTTPQSRQVHVLVVVPKRSPNDLFVENDSISAFRETAASIHRVQVQMQVLLEQNKANLTHKPNSFSDGALGQMESGRLKTDGMIIDAAPTENEEAFWPEAIQIQADAIQSEAAFDAFITPFFSDVLSRCGMVFVNSERYPWLSQSPLVTKNTDLKPDGFATHRGMFRAKPVPDDGVQRQNGFRFGVAVEELFDCLILFESKLTITDASFGQVVRYLQYLCPKELASAILFDRRSFWLIKSHRSVVTKVRRAKWVDKGSKTLFQSFITDNISPWVAHLTNACTSLGVGVVEGDAFLGRGAHGRVFKVTGPGQKVFALKIVEECSVGRLYQEKKALMKAQPTGLTITPVRDVIESTDGSAALLLSPVGKPLPRPTTLEGVRNLFGLLWQLHANSLVHGDPRVPNVILIGDTPLWIDLVEVMEATPTLKKNDADILARSILGVSRAFELDPATKQLIDNYGESATPENLDRLAEAVSLVFPN